MSVSLLTRLQLAGGGSHVTGGDWIDPKLRHLTGSHLEVTVETLKLAYNVRFTSHKLHLEGGSGHLTGNDVT